MIIHGCSQEEPDPDEPEAKRFRLEEEGDRRIDENDNGDDDVDSSRSSRRSAVPMRIDGGMFGRISLELFPNVLKFLSCEVGQVLPCSFCLVTAPLSFKFSY